MGMGHATEKFWTMTSVVSICKIALANLGADSINDLDEPTAEARACNLMYAHTRDMLLQVYPWRFAAKTASLGEVSNDKEGEWGHAYSRPIDCLKIRSIGPMRSGVVQCDTGSSPIPYAVSAGLIYCDVSPAYLNYTYRMTDPTAYPPLFVDALAWHLTVRLAMPLTRDPKVRADAFQLAVRAQGSAEMADANEERENSDHETEFVTGRA